MVKPFGFNGNCSFEDIHEHVLSLEGSVVLAQC